MKILLFAHGPGESCHAYAMLRYLAQQRQQTVFALSQEVNLPFYRGAGFPEPLVTPDAESLRALVATTHPDVVLLCNSKSFYWHDTFVEQRPWSTPTFSIDSNWLFDSSGFLRCAQWLDGYFAVFPPQVFALGLRENGGHFSLPISLAERVKPVGFLPSYPRPAEQIRQRVRHQLGVHESEKLVFCYVSGRGADLKQFVLQNVFEAVSQLRYLGYAIKACVVGNLPLLQQQFPCSIADWLIFRELTSDDFYLHLASADLVVQHQGLATMAQAISAQIPVIAHTQHLRRSGHNWLHNAELSPLSRSGLCKLFSSESAVEEIMLTMQNLLYNEPEIAKMRQAQQRYQEHSEATIYTSIMRYLEDNPTPASRMPIDEAYDVEKNLHLPGGERERKWESDIPQRGPSVE